MRPVLKSNHKCLGQLGFGLLRSLPIVLVAAATAHAEPQRAATGPVPPDFTVVLARLVRLVFMGRDWYLRTPAADRICWGGLAACACLALAVLIERMFRLRRRKIIPPDFTARFLDRLHEGKLDGGKALDYCEMNPSPAARVALAAVRRWGRPSVDLERAVSMAHRVEADRLSRNVGTLRRIAVIAPLLGLLGTLQAIERILSVNPPIAGGAQSWGPAVAAALGFLTLGITMATLSVVAFDALSVRIERLVGSLDRLGAETIDAIAMAVPVKPPALLADAPPQRSHGFHPAQDAIPHSALVSHPSRSQRRPGDVQPEFAPRAGRDLGS